MSVSAKKEKMIFDRYRDGANEAIPNLCCPTTYPSHLLDILPREIIERDYGCGDPTRHIKEGDVVLDLGSGAGKICYMAAQIVGPHGAVIGVDINDNMLALARKYQQQMVKRLNGTSINFKKCQIQNLSVDLEKVDVRLRQHPINNADDLKVFKQWKEQMPAAIESDSVDIVISNCVLNLVSHSDRLSLAKEIFRVLKPGGRIAISDIVSDIEVPQHLQNDPDLWADCISGATQICQLLQIFKDAGFHNLKIDSWPKKPWKVLERVEFRSVTLVATKQTLQPCLNLGHSVIYRGPFAEIRDDEGHVFPRGEKVTVCEQTYNSLVTGALAHDFISFSPMSSENSARNSLATPDGCAEGQGCC